jgi:hypothetical protein
MCYDPNLPKLLKNTQEWFASIITRPINIQNEMMRISPSGKPMEIEALEHILPSPTLKPHQRIELYNQQYWWRLLNTLHEIFPFLTRLFGYTDFNAKIAFPYMVKYPSNHWSLNEIGSRLPQWILEEYHEPDQELCYRAALIDCAHNDSFFVPELPAVDTDLETLFSTPLQLQPYLHLYQFPYDLFTFRKDLMEQEPEYWEENDFPELPKGKVYSFVLYRTKNLDMAWKEISSTEYALLGLFQKGGSIENGCEWLEGEPKEIQEEAEKGLQKWFQEWSLRKWLVKVTDA